MNPKWKEFGSLIKEKRKSQYSRTELAKILEKKASTIASWEQGYRRPKQPSLLTLSNLLGIPIQELQAKVDYTPEFNWYLSFTAQPDTEQDILLSATDEEKKELRKYLHYLRFKLQVTKTTQKRD